MKCPNCLKPMDITGWEAPQGMDPRLRQFKCSRCGEVVYKVPRGFEATQEVKVK